MLSRESRTDVKSVFTHVASIYPNLLEKKNEIIYMEKISTPRGFSGYTNMAAVSFFWKSNMAAVTSCENALYSHMNLDNF